MASFAEQLGIQSPLEWFEHQMAKSGLTQHVIDKAQIVAHPDGYDIPFFGMRGEPVNDAQRRLRIVPEGGRKCFRIKGMGTPRYPYWSPLKPFDFEKMNPIMVVEGEKKALCLHSKLLGLSIAAEVVAVTGVDAIDPLLRDLATIPMNGRVVNIIYDFNGAKQTSNDNVRRAEAVLALKLSRLGAVVKIVRWEFTEGEQKIDDWLVAGGSVYDWIYEDALPPDPRFEYFNDNYAKYQGRVIELSSGRIMTGGEFCFQYLHKGEVNDKGKWVEYAKLWIKWKHVPIIDKLIFDPALPRVIGTTLNLWQGWSVERNKGDVSLWLELLDNLGLDHWARMWLAQMFQQPSLPPTTYLALFGYTQGVGKGLFVRTLRNILPSVEGTKEFWLGQFNGGVKTAMLVYTDELMLDRASERKAFGSKIKLMVGNPTITIRAMQQNAYEQKNLLRFIFTGNSESVVYLDREDRRAAVYRCEDKWDKGAEYVEWLENGGAGAVLDWLLSYDITEFKAGEVAPSGEAKEDILEDSMDSYALCARWLEELAPDVIDGDWLKAAFVNVTESHYQGSSNNLGKSIRRYLKCGKSRKIKVGGAVRVFTPIRRKEVFEGASNDVWLKHFEVFTVSKF